MERYLALHPNKMKYVTVSLFVYPGRNEFANALICNSSKSLCVPFSGILTRYFLLHQHRLADVDVLNGNVIRDARGCIPGLDLLHSGGANVLSNLEKGKEREACSNLLRVHVNCKLYSSARNLDREALLQAGRGFLSQSLASLDERLRSQRAYPQ